MAAGPFAFWEGRCSVLRYRPESRSSHLGMDFEIHLLSRCRRRLLCRAERRLVTRAEIVRCAEHPKYQLECGFWFASLIGLYDGVDHCSG
ncbi:hypothetical protein GEM_4029 [Burkholderia cepacia GG4]|uniref:Uncharacterized protein n=1 Tax=Burkholderia cepacia GG4 TaxID=1009846 RepID=A0A9W3K502_BURCE|nr:hypothetical protein GEM_4029 [Burkholderia cepacia GG4]